MIDGFVALYIFMLAAFTGHEIIGRVPVILAQAELALADYHGSKHRRHDPAMRWGLLALMVIAGATLLAVLWRVLTLTG